MAPIYGYCTAQPISRVAGPLGGSAPPALGEYGRSMLEAHRSAPLASTKSASSPEKGNRYLWLCNFVKHLFAMQRGPDNARKALQVPLTRMKVLLPSTSSVEHLSYGQTSKPPLHNVFPLLAFYPTRSMFSRKTCRGQLQGWPRRIPSISWSDPRTQPWVDTNNPRLLPAWLTIANHLSVSAKLKTALGIIERG